MVWAYPQHTPGHYNCHDFQQPWNEIQPELGWISKPSRLIFRSLKRFWGSVSLSRVYLKIMFMLTLSPSTYYLVFFRNLNSCYLAIGLGIDRQALLRFKAVRSYSSFSSLPLFFNNNDPNFWALVPSSKVGLIILSSNISLVKFQSVKNWINLFWLGSTFSEVACYHITIMDHVSIVLISLASYNTMEKIMSPRSSELMFLL